MKSLLITLFLSFSIPTIAQEMTISGTMHHTTLEGGCWYLQGDAGKRFELIGDTGIVHALNVEGKHVAVRAIPAKGAASTCMMGEIVRVLERLDSVRYPTDPVISPMLIDGSIHRTASGKWYVKTSTGKRFEFLNPPSKNYRHIGLAVHQKYRVLLQSPDKMNGVILPESKNTNQPAKQRTYDPR
jgi:hypothetical protein